MKKIKFKSKFLLFTIVMSTIFVVPTYARMFGWGSNNDCIVVAMPSDSKDISACIGGTETYYFLWIPIRTRTSISTYGQVH